MNDGFNKVSRDRLHCWESRQIEWCTTTIRNRDGASLRSNVHHWHTSDLEVLKQMLHSVHVLMQSNASRSRSWQHFTTIKSWRITINITYNNIGNNCQLLYIMCYSLVVLGPRLPLSTTIVNDHDLNRCSNSWAQKLRIFDEVVPGATWSTPLGTCGGLSHWSWLSTIQMVVSIWFCP